MISGAIYKLINVASVTDLVNNISLVVGVQGVDFPQVVINETSEPENYKDNYSIINHRVQIDIYCSKGKDGNGGYLQADTIANAIEALLNRYSGVVTLSDTLYNNIAQIYLQDKDLIYDSQPEAARISMTYHVREKVSIGVPPPDYPITVSFYVNGELDSTQVVNGYENNTFNVTA